ncbi:prepilin peptidase [Actinokineospora globicatena]|uniref:prepilin peptidase n=1 Tax=Actinokineospora globicatena TaxID=103729 RepID=UPI0020A29CBC|nr:A24 family peptidase [Actinokineospora globicatena]GLW78553.1 hypothetical protein Aglo01_30350 [Actinokineospora globicatena]GLW84783.1 hypothetical protein Aglo02_24230 [Actinokineospora globicatena]
MTDWIFVAAWALLGAMSAYPAAGLVRTLDPAGSNSPVRQWQTIACTAAVFAVLAARLGLTSTLLAYSTLTSIIIPITATDLREHRLPTRPIAWTAAAITLIFGIAAITTRRPDQLVQALISAGVCLAMLTSAYLITPGFVGGGDIRLAGLLVLALGWTGWVTAIRGIVIGVGLGAAYGLYQLLRRRITRSAHVPLGPALALGSLLSVLAV